MASVSGQTSTMGTNLQVDMSEERRLAQLRRIEELKTQIGNIPWLNQQSNNHLHQGIERNSITSLSNSAISSQSPEIQQNSENLGQTSYNSQQGTPDTDMPDWLGTDIAADNLNIGKPVLDLHSNHVSRYSVDILDDISNSQRTGSAMSKHSALSSNTSAEMSGIHIKDEPIEAIQLDEQPRLAAQSEVPEQAELPRPTIAEGQSPAKRRRISKDNKSYFSTLRAKTAIPSDVPHEELARQSCEAALWSRLNPFVLHPEEYRILRDHICHSHVSAYLNIRNRILRLWVRNPLVTVTAEEAAGCAYSSRWLGLAEVAYEWLVRRGYINFGCVQVPDLSDLKAKKPSKNRARKTIVVVGAGMAGLGCARQLEGLFSHYREAWTVAGKEPPRVVVYEGRPRIGGRIYSHQLHNQNTRGIPKGLRSTAECGAHIITGFDHGNPLNMIIRGQLALHYHAITDNEHFFDVDGKVANPDRDRLVEKLFNDILERASHYRHIPEVPDTVKGDQSLIEDGKDPSGEVGKPISVVEEERKSILNKPATLSDKGLVQVPAGLDKLTGKTNLVTGTREKKPSSQALKEMGWELPEEIPELDLDTTVNSTQFPTLGATIDEGIKQYQRILNLNALDLRLLNWHIANLEYANAANLGKLSLGGWDQDNGNEFLGEHCQVIGGYQQVPRGIMEYPTPLDVRTGRNVGRIEYDPEGDDLANVYCSGGESLDADHVVVTLPLGVLKKKSTTFSPALPEWKTDSIGRLGFGLLNKVILVYDKPFWNVDEDVIGFLQEADPPNSLNQDDYVSKRGRCYLMWNTIKTSGRPVLIGMLAGDAAFQAEKMSDGEIISEVTEQLATMYRHKTVPLPSEAIVTRWGRDKFALGTYSNVGPEASAEDYDIMAKRVGNLHFAGEATCGTHPATVHGAYISGLRAAGEIIDDYLGPINVPSPLVPPIIKPEPKAAAASTVKLDAKAEAQAEEAAKETEEEKNARLDGFETEIIKAILAKLGPRPDKPDKQGSNPFLLFSKDKWADCKTKCDDTRRAVTGNPAAKASRNDIRAALGLMWREASEEVKKPYVERTLVNRVANHENASSFHDRLAEWDTEAMSIRREYVNSHPGVLSREEEENMWQALGVFAGIDRKAKKMSGYADTPDGEGQANSSDKV
jgi:monoamine oxidase